MKTSFYILAGILVLALVLVQMGVLGGSRPADLGVSKGRLKPPSPTPNSVSSQAGQYPDHPQREYAQIPPLPLRGGSAAASMQTLATVLTSMPRTKVFEQRPDYLYAQATTRWLKFTDDIEFWFDPARAAIELRSASRLGGKDFGVNRQRIEAIRTAYLAQP